MSSFVLMNLVLGAVLIYIVKALLTHRKYAGPLPPGPVGKPIVGNISDLPPPGAQDWMHWLKHKELYGKLPGRCSPGIWDILNRIER
jgi:hypothetical protein